MNDSKKEAKYIFNSETTPTEFGNMMKYFPKFYWQYVRQGTLLLLSLIAISGMFAEQSKKTSMIVFVIVEIIVLILYKVRLCEMGEASFLKSMRKYPIDTYFTNELYEEHFIRIGEYTTRRIPYNRISRTIETEKHFYMELDGGIIILQKYRCTDEIIKFLRDKCKESLNITNKNVFIENIKSREMLSVLMQILFILNCICIPLATYSFYAIVGQGDYTQFFEHCWIFWLWLPIPVMSFVLGLKHKKNCASFDKNILSGFIVGVFLLLLGCFKFFPI